MRASCGEAPHPRWRRRGRSGCGELLHLHSPGGGVGARVDGPGPCHLLPKSIRPCPDRLLPRSRPWPSSAWLDPPALQLKVPPAAVKRCRVRAFLPPRKADPTAPFPTRRHGTTPGRRAPPSPRLPPPPLQLSGPHLRPPPAAVSYPSYPPFPPSARDLDGPPVPEQSPIFHPFTLTARVTMGHSATGRSRHPQSDQGSSNCSPAWACAARRAAAPSTAAAPRTPRRPTTAGPLRRLRLVASPRRRGPHSAAPSGLLMDVADAPLPRTSRWRSAAAVGPP